MLKAFLLPPRPQLSLTIVVIVATAASLEADEAHEVPRKKILVKLIVYDAWQKNNKINNNNNHNYSNRSNNMHNKSNKQHNNSDNYNNATHKNNNKLSTFFTHKN